MSEPQVPFLPIAEARAANVRPLTVPALKRRNRAWTDSMIRKLLGAPDALMHNPNGGKMRVYHLARVEVAEANAKFAATDITPGDVVE